MRRPALLVLEDGSAFRGESIGAAGTATGEICFNTSMTGYQEILTDPSYHGQIVTLTCVQVGNTGVNDHDDQSIRPWAGGLVVRDAARANSWRSQADLEVYLATRGVVGITDVDTRRLTRHIRERGAMRAALSDEDATEADLVDVARATPPLTGRDLASEVSTATPYHWSEADLDRRAASGYAPGRERDPATRALLRSPSGPRAKVAAIDLGLKRNILDLLVASGCDVTVLPGTTPPETISNDGYDGVFVSNGPGDPEPVRHATETVRDLLGKLPVFGICLGHQILGLALGGRTYKLPFGHRGGNHPVRRIGSDRVEITCQNHGFAVDAASIAPTGADLTHVNLNDGTVEGLELPGVAFSVQYHPESAPGPHDSRYLFEKFADLIKTFEPRELDLAAPR